MSGETTSIEDESREAQTVYLTVDVPELGENVDKKQ
jgi:hypothetical protein